MHLFELAKNRGFQYAIAITMLWHFFWFFAVTIDVKTPAAKSRQDFRVHFVGPVLSDDAFNMIVALKPELSQTRYHIPEDFTQNLEPATGSLDRRSPGDLVSVPMGRTTWSALRGTIQGEKPYADTDFYHKFSIDVAKSPFSVSGDLKDRDLLYLPDVPKQPLSLKLEQPSGVSDAEFEITVDPSGTVTRVENLISSGDPEADLMWQRYLRKWQFMPLERVGKAPVQKGQVRVTFDRKNKI